MDLDELLEQTTPHENTPVPTNQNVARAARVAVAVNIAALCLYSYHADADPDLAGWFKPAALVITWAHNPTIATTLTTIVTAVGVLLGVYTRGFTQANLPTHQAINTHIALTVLTTTPVLIATVFAAAVMVIWTAILAAFTALVIGIIIGFTRAV